jgi:heme exporter protein C
MADSTRALSIVDGTRRQITIAAVPASLLAASFFAIFVLAPTEQTMGDVQRIMYVHISLAWLALLGMVIAAGTGLVYLVRRDLAWDHWSQSAGELGWLAATLTLVTGSLWASEAWGTWWTWDPRLTTMFVLWLVYSGCLTIRAIVVDSHHRACACAVLAIFGTIDVPLVVMATRWFRGMHPVAPQMDPAMRAVLLFTAFSFAAFFGVLLVLRRNQIRTTSVLSCSEKRGATARLLKEAQWVRC